MYNCLDQEGSVNNGYRTSEDTYRDPLTAPGVPDPSERDRAVAVARVVLRAPNIDNDSDIALLARQLLRALGLSER